MAQNSEVAKTRSITASALPLPATPAAVETVAKAVSVVGDERRTRLTLTLSAPTDPKIYTLAEPYRVVVELNNVLSKLPASAGRDARGLIKAYRFGLFAPERSRLVIDAAGPVKVASATMTPVANSAFALTIDLESVAAAAFVVAPPPSRVRRPGLDAPVLWPQVGGSTPVIVIDPGHGGIDSGAVAPGDVLEKHVVLAVAARLKALLDKSGRYAVRMTRSNDVFVSLDHRVDISRSEDASLFVSIHADSIANTGVAQSVRGATVYTLSEQASHKTAQALADKENSVDSLAGIEAIVASDDDQVKGILADLLQRETQAFSLQMRGALLDKMRGAMALARDPARSAAFRVLQQSHAPSVLIELGYMSNEQDARLLQSPDWQGRVVRAIASAIDDYFVQRGSKAP